jgi:hypothetical protein
MSCAADTKAWEVDTLRGHVNNVSCVMFHARQVKSHMLTSLAASTSFDNLLANSLHHPKQKGTTVCAHP